MRSLLLLAAVLSAGSAFAASNPAETVPFDHWAHDAVSKLVDARLLPPFRSDPFGHDLPWTRGEFAAALLHASRLEESLASPVPRQPCGSWECNCAAARLVGEFWPELESMLTEKGAADQDGLCRWLTGIPPGNWLYETAQAVLRDRFRGGAAPDPAESLPFDHWAYGAMRKATDAIMPGSYPPGTFAGDRPRTRYEFALAAMRLLDVPETAGARARRPSPAAGEGVGAALQLMREFWPEVELIASQLDGMEGFPAEPGEEPTESADRLRAWLAGIPAGNWLYPAAQAILREYYGVATAAEPFPDVPREHWAYGAVERLRLAGIVVGYPDGTFGGRTASAQ